MAKPGEIDYVRKLTPEEVLHARTKPFSDASCGQYLMDLGVLFTLLPAPPATMLDLGVGPGWTSLFFAERGYTVVGQDIAGDMIALCEEKRARVPDRLSFIVSDYEALAFDREFDGAVFYDALHHAEHEERALASAFRALKPGGLCLTVEPGEGHAGAAASVAAMARFGVVEKDMSPARITALGRQIGFSAFEIYERPHRRLLACHPDGRRWPAYRRVRRMVEGMRALLTARRRAFTDGHIVALRK